MNYKTDYFNIHEKRYKELKKNNFSGWSGTDTENIAFQMFQTIKRAVSKYKISTKSRLLELGCGNGCLTILLSRFGFDSYGIDISPTAINWAIENSKKENIKIDYSIGNVLNLPYPDDYFNIIIDGHCFHCIIDDDRKTFLHEALRVLRPGGIFIIMTMCGEPAKSIIEKFDIDNGNLISKGIAGRYIGKPSDILEEIELSKLNILEWTIFDNDDQDELLIITNKE